MASRRTWPLCYDVAHGLMPDVAKKLFGEPPRHTAREWRYGRKGSLRVDIEKGTWKDFESDKGGGVIALVRRELSLDRSKAVKWLIQDGFLEKSSPRLPQNQQTDPGPLLPANLQGRGLVRLAPRTAINRGD